MVLIPGNVLEVFAHDNIRFSVFCLDGVEACARYGGPSSMFIINILGEKITTVIVTVSPCLLSALLLFMCPCVSVPVCLFSVTFRKYLFTWYSGCHSSVCGL